jgi:hypothetical protein
MGEIHMKRILNLQGKTGTKNVNGKEKPFVKLHFACPSEEECNPKEFFVFRSVTSYELPCGGEEYFYHLLPTKNDLFYRGKVEAKQNSPSILEFIDENVELGKTYVYWVSYDEDMRSLSKNAPVTVRDPQIFWRQEKIVATMERLCNEYPQAEIVKVGRTTRGMPLYALRVGNRENCIALCGVVHAGESGPEIALTVVEEILKNNPAILQKTGLAIMPTVNGDMREKFVQGNPWYLRTNPNGVDINRNFPKDWEEIGYDYGLSTADEESITYRGSAPMSEWETQSLVNFIELVKPRAAFSYHWLYSVCSDNFIGAGGEAITDLPFREWIEGMTRAYSDAFREAINEPKRPKETVFMEGSGGGFSRWLYSKGIFGVDVEHCCWELRVFANVKEKGITTRETLAHSIKGHLQGIQAVLKYFES